MSGHAHFTVIGGARPQLPVDQSIGVNQDISRTQFVGGVGAPGVPQPNEPAGEVVAPQPSAGMEKTNELIRQLDVLLSRAAVSAAKCVDATAVKDALLEVNLSNEDRNTLNAVAEKAEAAYKAINNFTGRQLAAAVAADVNGKFDWARNPAGKAIKEALDAQAELSDQLRQVVRHIPGGATATSLEEAMMQCDRRACEIQTLVCQFADILEKGEPNDPAVKGRLDATLATLIPRQALEMHGNDAALAAMKESVAPLAQRLDELAQAQGTPLSSEKLAAVRRDIDRMSNALEAAVQTGVAGESGIGVDRTLFAAAKSLLGETRQKLGTVRQDIVQTSMLNFADKVFAQIPVKILEEKFLPILKATAPTLAKIVDARKKLREAAREYAKDPTDLKYTAVKNLAAEYASQFGNDKEISHELKDLAKNYAVVTRGRTAEENAVLRLTAAVKNSRTADAGAVPGEKLIAEFAKAIVKFAIGFFPKPNNSPDVIAFSSYIAMSRGINSQVAHIDLMRKTAGKMSDEAFITNDTVLAAFEGKVRFTTLVEARLHGFDDSDVDPSVDDVNCVSSNKLGSGNVNTVYEVSYKDGSTYIFKPEAAGRQSYEKLALSHGTRNEQMVAELNMAAQKAAESLGLTDVMTNTTVGSHNGEFGIFMEKAPGLESSKFCKTGVSIKAPDGDLSSTEIKKLPDTDYARVVGSLMRSANRLDWFDMITGQGDRHTNNYMVSVKKTGPNVPIKGIDNDAGFPDYRIGIRKFKLSSNRADRFVDQIEEAAFKLCPGKSARAVREREKLYGRLIADPGIETDDEGNIVAVDTTKFESPVLHWCLLQTYGIHSTALPDHIDAELYDKLMGLAEPGPKRDKYIADMTAHLPATAKDAAIERLDDAIAHAKSLAKKGHVVSGDDWNLKEKQREIAGKVPPDPNKGGYESKIPGWSSAGIDEIGLAVDHLVNGYFRRDLMRAVAKPGWFEE